MQSPLDNTQLNAIDVDKTDRIREFMSPALFNEVFKQKITLSHWELMQRRVLECLNDPSFPTGIEVDKTLVWSCIVFGDRTCDPDNMIQLAELLQIDSKELLPIACYFGYTALLNRMLQGKSDAEKVDLIKYDNYAGYSGANKQNLDVRIYLEKQTNGLLTNELKQADYKSAFDLFKSALKKGHHDVLFHLDTSLPEFLKTLRETTHGGGTNDYHDLLCLASRLGDVKILKELLSFTPTQVALDNYKMVRVAGEKDCLAVFKHIKKRCPGLKQLDAFYEFNGIFSDYSTLARSGGLDTLKKIEEQYDKEFVDDLIQHNDYQVFRDAVTGGQLKVIQHLENHLGTDEKCENMVQAKNYEGFSLAIAHRKTDVALHMLTYKSCYDYVSNNARSEPVDLILRSFEDEQHNIEKLTNAIMKLRVYGTKLTEEDEDVISQAEGQKTIVYANGLKELMDAYLKAKKEGNSNELAHLHNRFTDELARGDQLMGTHRAEWKSILAEIAIAFTGIGLILIVGKYLLTGNTFFSQTNRQKNVEEIKDTFVEYFSHNN